MTYYELGIGSVHSNPSRTSYYTTEEFVLTRLSFCILILQPRKEESLIVAYSVLQENVHSVEQKSTGLKFSKSRTGSDVLYTCHHNSSRFIFPIFAHSWRFSVFLSLQSVTPRIY